MCEQVRTMAPLWALTEVSISRDRWTLRGAWDYWAVCGRSRCPRCGDCIPGRDQFGEGSDDFPITDRRSALPSFRATGTRKGQHLAQSRNQENLQGIFDLVDSSHERPET